MTTIPIVHTLTHVMQPTAKPQTRKNWRCNLDDLKVLEALKKKLGLPEADVLRLSIRKLADAEGIPR